jgi:hypothetical protein
MRHLSETELLDVAEGTVVEGAQTHLAACGSCREQVADLRALLSAAGDVTVPEPSPLYWDHLSARVREQVDALGDERSNASRGSGWRFWRLAVPAAVLGAIVVAAVMTWPRPPAAVPANTMASAVEGAADTGTEALADDPSLSLIADLAGDLDWDGAIEAGLAAGAGAVDHALFNMSEDERLQLQQMLKEELSGFSGRGV